MWCIKFPIFFLVSYVKERPRWPVQSPNKDERRKRKAKEEREIRSSLLILDLKSLVTHSNRKCVGIGKNSSSN